MDNRILTRLPLQPNKIGRQQSQEIKNRVNTGKTPFKELLANQLKEKSDLKFSKHAQDRLITRGIKINENDLNKLETGFTKAADKGSKESLIMVNEVAYVVSVENKTVITAIDNQSLKENVFTNIDSAVFM